MVKPTLETEAKRLRQLQVQHICLEVTEQTRRERMEDDSPVSRCEGCGALTYGVHFCRHCTSLQGAGETPNPESGDSHGVPA